MNDYSFLPQNKMKDSCLVLDQAVVCVQRFQFRGQRWSQANLIPIDSGSVLEYVSVPWDSYWRFPEIGLLSAIIHFFDFSWNKPSINFGVSPWLWDIYGFFVAEMAEWADDQRRTSPRTTWATRAPVTLLQYSRPLEGWKKRKMDDLSKWDFMG